MPIAFEQVSFSYDPKATPALDNVSLTIADGEFACVIGHTGSGKSTLAELACATKVPTSGRVVANGIDTSLRKTRGQVRRQVGYVMQFPERQLFAETVLEDVEFGPRNLGLSATEVDHAVRRALDVVGLPYDDVAQASPFDLSGGQRRRAALAGVIAMGPRALVLDEPMAGLDPRGRQDVLDILLDLQRDGTTILMVSHSMDDVARVAEHVVVLSHGRLADEGSPADVFSHEGLLHDAGLGLPQAAQVARDLMGRGFRFPQGIPLTVDELARAIAAELGTARGEDAS